MLADSSCTVAEPGFDAGEVVRVGKFLVVLLFAVAVAGLAHCVEKLTRVVAAALLQDLVVD